MSVFGWNCRALGNPDYSIPKGQSCLKVAQSCFSLVNCVKKIRYREFIGCWVFREEQGNCFALEGSREEVALMRFSNLYNDIQVHMAGLH